MSPSDESSLLLESIKFDVFSSISLPLVTFKDQSTIRLEDCIEKFMEGEQLDDLNAWYCPGCKKHVCALKMIALWSVPDILMSGNHEAIRRWRRKES